jgi:hypothetical protein
MAFLAPLFLFALAAIAVPLLVHLTHRQRREPVAFPSLMFLRRVEFKTTKRQRLRDRLLFAMRLLALVLLVAAFARPFVSDSTAAPTAANPGRDVVVLVDASFSMRAGGRWAAAQAAARRIVDGMGPGDRATLVRFAGRAEAVQQPTGDKGTLRAAIDAMKPGDETGRYAPALSLARTAASRAERPRREVLLVTDLQRTGWAPDAELRLPDGVRFDVVDVGEETPANLAVTGVDFLRTTSDGREQVVATARVANRADVAAERVPVAIALDGREVATAVATVPANGVAAVRLGPFALPSATVRGQVTAGRDALPGDDVRHFTLDRGRSLGVLLVQDPTASPARTLYLRRALEIGGDPAFRVDVDRDGGPTMAQLLDHQVVILDDARPPRGQMARRLVDWVSSGGGMIVTFGERARSSDWAGDLAPLLPGAVGEPVDRMGDGGGRLGTLDRSHPVLEPFAAPRSGNFSAPRFFRHRAITPAEGVASVARWDDGSVALAERRVGRGRVLAWGSTLDNVWSDLPLQPVFLPLVRQLVQHAASWDGERPWETVGAALDLSGLSRSAGADSATAEWVVLSPTGRQERLTPRSASLALDEAGVWEVRRFGMRGAPARLVAVNVDPAESDLARVEKAEVMAAVAPNAQATGGPIDAASLTEEEQESRQSLWWFLLLAAALLFAAETVLSNRLRTVGR